MSSIHSPVGFLTGNTNQLDLLQNCHFLYVEDMLSLKAVKQEHSSSSRMRVIYHNWSDTKQRPHPQSVAEISRHSVLSGDRIRQCETSSGSRHKDTDQCLQVAISFCRHRSVPVPCENGSAETTVAEGGRYLVAGLWGHTLGEN